MPAIPRRPRADWLVTDRSLITTGAIGAILAALCCFTSLLAVVLGAVGLSAWLAESDLVAIPVLLVGVLLVGLGLYRRRAAAPRCGRKTTSYPASGRPNMRVCCRPITGFPIAKARRASSSAA